MLGVACRSRSASSPPVPCARGHRARRDDIVYPRASRRSRWVAPDGAFVSLEALLLLATLLRASSSWLPPSPPSPPSRRAPWRPSRRRLRRSSAVLLRDVDGACRCFDRISWLTLASALLLRCRWRAASTRVFWTWFRPPVVVTWWSRCLGSALSRSSSWRPNTVASAFDDSCHEDRLISERTWLASQPLVQPCWDADFELAARACACAQGLIGTATPAPGPARVKRRGPKPKKLACKGKSANETEHSRCWLYQVR